MVQGEITTTGAIETLTKQPLYNLRFNISGDWGTGMDSVMAIVERLKEKHPDSKVQAEVQFLAVNS